MDKKYKIYIPNILTLSRIILVIFISFFHIFNLNKLAIFLIVLASITDFLDGFLARKWNTTSISGAKLDTIADKVFGIVLLISLIFNNKMFIIILTFELLISLFNIYFYKKTNITKSLYIGKFKTTFLFITIIESYLGFVIDIAPFIQNGFIYSVINLQVLCLILYTMNYLNYKKNKPSINYNKMHKEIMEEKTLILNDLKDIENGIYDYEKDEY